MSSFALFVLILVLVAAFLGWRSGLMKQLGQVVGVILGIAVCRMFAPSFVNALCGENSSNTDSALYTVLVYVVLFIVVYIGVSIIGTVVKKVLNAVFLGVIDRIGGVVFRVVEWLVLLSLVLNLWIAIVPDTDMVNDDLFVRVLGFAPYLLGTETAVKLGSLVTTAIHG